MSLSNLPGKSFCARGRVTAGVFVTTMLCLAWWPQAECRAQKVPANAAAPLPSAYKIVVRVVRPVWNAETLRLPDPPRALSGNSFRFADPDSDAQFLEALQKENPGFVFGAVRAKRALTLPIDAVWKMPGDVTFQKLQLGIFAKNKDLLLNHIAVPASSSLSRGKTSKSVPPPVSYKAELTEGQGEQARQSGSIILSYWVQQCFPDEQNENKLKPYAQSDLIQFMQPGDTICVGTALAVLDVPIDPKPAVYGKPGSPKPGPTPTKAALMPTDLIFVTVEK